MEILFYIALTALATVVTALVLEFLQVPPPFDWIVSLIIFGLGVILTVRHIW